MIHYLVELLWSIVIQSWQCHSDSSLSSSLTSFFSIRLILSPFRHFSTHIEHPLYTPFLNVSRLISHRWRCFANIVISFTVHFTWSMTHQHCSLYWINNQIDTCDIPLGGENNYIHKKKRERESERKIIGRLRTIPVE